MTTVDQTPNQAVEQKAMEEADRISVATPAVPLLAIHKFVLRETDYTINDEAKEPFRGFTLFKLCADVLCQFRPDDVRQTNPLSINNEQWETMLADVECGLVKQTKTCGTSSVSFGLASKLFAFNETNLEYDSQGRRYIALINGGTGGFKFQVMMETTDKHLSCAMEFKGSGTCPPNPNQQVIGSYQPTRLSDIITPEQELQHATAWLKAAEQAFIDKTGHDLRSKHVLCFAFVTGPIRNHWETLQGEAKDRQADALATYMDKIAPMFRPYYDYFLSQDDESQLEQDAVRCMYFQLFQKRLVPTLYYASTSAGLGGGSMQFFPWSEPLGIKSSSVHELPHRLKTKLETTKLAERFYQVFTTMPSEFLQRVPDGPLRDAQCKPIIALKSLFVMALDQIPALRQNLLRFAKDYVEQHSEEKGKDSEATMKDVEEKVKDAEEKVKDAEPTAPLFIHAPRGLLSEQEDVEQIVSRLLRNQTPGIYTTRDASLEFVRTLAQCNANAISELTAVLNALQQSNQALLAFVKSELDKERK